LRPTPASINAIVTISLIVGLLAGFLAAAWFSYYGGVNIRDAFAYQSAVVAAQRDSELLEFEQFDRKASPAELRPYEKLLDSDLARIDAIADAEAERAPRFSFPAARQDYERLTDALHEREVLGRQRFDETVDRNTRTRDLSNALFVLVALGFTVLQDRLRTAIEEGRSLVERLQRAFISKRRELPNVDLGSVLISATQGSNVGGDTHDVFTFDRKYGMFLVADVSGKGIDAAVDTALVKYTIRTLFSGDVDPGRVLEKFAAIYARSAESLESFVALFLGVIELESGKVWYASAGHEPAWFHRGQEVVVLPPTGPIVGIDSASEYETKTLLLEHGDALVISTDGLTESRDARGNQLGAEGVAVWLSQLEGGAQTTADAVVRRLRRRSRRIADDLAILVVRYAPRLRAGTRARSDGITEEADSRPALVSGEAPS